MSDATISQKASRRWPVISATVAILLAAALGAILALRPDEPLAVDLEWMEEMLDERNAVIEALALVMNYLGGGIIGVVIVPAVVIVAFLIARRPWAALYFTLSIIASAGLVQLLKQLVGRARPEEILVVADYGSFPSGHTANAATMAVVFGLVFGRLWIWAAGFLYTAMMAFSRTYLGAHWLSDTIGGILIGAGVAVIIWAPFADRLEREREQHRRNGIAGAA